MEDCSAAGFGSNNVESSTDEEVPDPQALEAQQADSEGNIGWPADNVTQPTLSADTEGTANLHLNGQRKPCEAAQVPE